MKKYLHIEIQPVPEGMTDLYTASSYPAPGLYRDKDGYFRVVTERNVDTIIYGWPDGAVINDNPGTGAGMTEELLLKAIAAASRAETLK